MAQLSRISGRRIGATRSKAIGLKVGATGWRTPSVKKAVRVYNSGQAVPFMRGVHVGQRVRHPSMIGYTGRPGNAVPKYSTPFHVRRANELIVGGTIATGLALSLGPIAYDVHVANRYSKALTARQLQQRRMAAKRPRSKRGTPHSGSRVR